MLKYVGFMGDLSEEYLYCGGILFINTTLPAVRILEIIKEHLDVE